MTADRLPNPDGDEPIDPTLAAIAAAILDGGAVDWSSLGDSAAGAALSDEFRIVADIAGVHRSLPDEPVDHVGFPPSFPWTHGTLVITAPLGMGTFGEVFRAWDTELHRDVALKLLFPRRDERGDERPLAEGRLLARIRHPNVVAVHSVERMEGRVGLVTEFINGRTLAEIVAEQGPMPVADAVRIAVDLCRALDAVHSAGVLHRDVKPQNVMRDHDGRIVLMDLGAGEQADAAHDLAGTPLYLAPEVLDGATASSQSDIYSLGVLLHYLVTGTHPVTGGSVAEIRDAHRRRARTLLRNTRPDLPRAFAAAIDTATDPEPSLRFQSAAAMGDAISGAATRHRSVRRAIAVATAALLLILGGGLAWRVLRPPVHQTLGFQARELVLVTAFDSPTGDAQLGRTVERALAHELSDSRYVSVVPRPRIDDALTLMAKPATTVVDAAIGREVALRDGGIKVLIAGEVERIDAGCVLTTRIVQASTGSVLASKRAEADNDAEIAGAIRQLSTWVRRQLGESPPQIQDSVARLEKVKTPSLQALRLYSEAYEAGSRRQWKQSAEIVRAALEHDPEFPSAHIWLAHTLRNLGRPPGEYVPHAQRAFDLSTDTSERERYFIQGSYYSMVGDDTRALDAYHTLLQLHPDHFWALNNAQVVAERLGRPRHEVTSLMTRVAAARPNDFYVQAQTAQSLLGTYGRKEAEPYVSRARALMSSAPPRPGPPILLWMQLLPFHEFWTAGRYREAAATVERFGSGRDVDSGGDPALVLLGSLRLTLGQIARAEQLFGRISNVGQRSIMLAFTDLARGNRAAVSERLRSYEGNDVTAVSLLVRAGDIRRARLVLDRMPSVPRHSVWAAAELATVEGNRQSHATLDEGIQWLRGLTGARAFFYSETMAASLAAADDAQGAIRVLEQTSTLGERLYARVGPLGYLWLRVRHQLAGLYRTVGRTDEARTIERELRDALITAEQDHPMLVELEQLARERAPARGR